MRESYIRKLCIIYLIINVSAPTLGIVLFYCFSPLPAVFCLYFIKINTIPAVIMLLLALKYDKAFYYIKAKLHYILTVQITMIAFLANGIESISLLSLILIPAIAHSLDEDIIFPSAIILIIFTFFVISYHNPLLSSLLAGINILPDNNRFYNVNSAYIILYYLLFIAQLLQALYNGKVQKAYTGIIIKKNMQLKSEKQFKESMLIYLTHELKTPHTLIKNGLEKVSLKYPELQLDPDFLATTGEVNRVVSGITNIFDEETANIASPGYNHESVLALSLFLREKALLYSNYAELKGIKLIAQEIESDLYIKAADEAIDKVVNNLLDNAIKYTPKGGRIVLSTKVSEDKVELVIEDNGIGISPEKRENIFNRYYQVRKRAGGVGLGLYLVKNILDTLGANIAIESEEGRGTAVRIKFESHCIERDSVVPGYSISKPAINPETFAEVRDSEYNSSLQTLLVVEDEVTLLSAFKKMLEDRYNIVTATNGLSAIEKLNSRKVDLILSDIRMPLMNGVDFCKKIKCYDEYKEIPFIFITAGGGDLDKIKCLKLGAIDYICKPFSFNEIDLRLKNYLRQQESLVNSVRTEIIEGLEKGYQEKIDRLPARLKEIAGLLCRQPLITNREIAELLDIKPGSVAGYIKEIARKFELHSERKSEVIKFLRKYMNS